ncbi:MAG: porin family protein [Planctomycetes bacterium]|nr:porin family protein [Planctomycetota bacterium]
MKTLVLSLVLFASAAANAAGQDNTSVDLSGTPPAGSDREAGRLPRTLASEFNPSMEEEASFSIGPTAGYLRARGADQGAWFGGAQARLHFARILAAEGSLTFHQNRYEHGDVGVTQYPVQLTAFLYLIPEGPLRPYLLGGLGWYYTTIEYKGVFSPISDKTEHIFGEHLGAGAELRLGPKASIDADLRTIFLNPSTDQVIHRDFNYWQVTLGVNLFF